MGLDYSYVTVIRRTDKPRLMEQLSRKVITETLDSGNGVIIDFKLDKTIKDYLMRTIRELEGIRLKTTLLFKKARFRDHFPDDESGRIGFLYMDEKGRDGADYVFVRFTAATTSMSVLLDESVSIKNWFLELSIAINAITTFLDLEHNGYHFIYGNEQGINISLPQEAVDTNIAEEDQFYKSICDEYKALFYLY